MSKDFNQRSFLSCTRADDTFGEWKYQHSSQKPIDQFSNPRSQGIFKTINTLQDRKGPSSDADQIRDIKNQINLIHDLLHMKDKLKRISRVVMRSMHS
jgi:hypothetical protein